ncbi:hypothetical protein K7X08_027163 [Anisodus acutangulus]|uniref:HMA domain-containing protein n=1 Tax=Anisodus acutangulus TaxID=402998 RepID=A0A9Q1MLW4_9SOLA|nr:hypothetical protein K7X08_027163 [Anisodus acutangulus]
MPRGRPLSLQTVELKVRMCCPGCERVVKDSIQKLRGVDSIEVEVEMEKVTVVGYVDRKKVLKAVRRSGKRAEFWPYPNPPLYFTSSNNYFKDTATEYKESYNYWRHGYNATDKHVVFPPRIVEMTSASANENCVGWAARDPSGVLSLYEFSRRAVGSDDVLLDIAFCGICFADVVWTRNKLGHSKYPLVPGHEIAGTVREVGADVKNFKVGDHVGVGTYVNSCRECEYCSDGLEIHCEKGAIYTFDGIDVDGTVTKGGYSSYIVVNERYCFRIPENYPLASAAPLLCAGITVYTPMIRHNMNQPGKSLGVVGLGGLGHLAVKFGKAFGLNVTVFSTSISKREEALKILGADKFVISSDEQQMTALSKSFDFIINTASGDIPFDPYLSLLKTAGILVLVGFPSEVKFIPGNLVLGMKSIVGSVTGGTKQTQEMLDFCAAHKIYPEIEIVPIQYANEALERLIKKDVKYRFVIDVGNSLK